MPAETQPLPSVDEHSDEDTLSSPLRVTNAAEDIRAIRDGTPWPDGLYFAREPRPIGLGDRKVKCGASMADAVIEDRR